MWVFVPDGVDDVPRVETIPTVQNENASFSNTPQSSSYDSIIRGEFQHEDKFLFHCIFTKLCT